MQATCVVTSDHTLNLHCPSRRNVCSGQPHHAVVVCRFCRQTISRSKDKSAVPVSTIWKHFNRFDRNRCTGLPSEDRDLFLSALREADSEALQRDSAAYERSKQRKREHRAQRVLGTLDEAQNECRAHHHRRLHDGIQSEDRVHITKEGFITRSWQVDGYAASTRAVQGHSLRIPGSLATSTGGPSLTYGQEVDVRQARTDGEWNPTAAGSRGGSSSLPLARPSVNSHTHRARDDDGASRPVWKDLDQAVRFAFENEEFPYKTL